MSHYLICELVTCSYTCNQNRFYCIGRLSFTKLSTDASHVEESYTSFLSVFDPVSNNEVVQIVRKGQDVLTGPIAKCLNTPLSQGIFPLSVKTDKTKPLMKKHTLH